MAYEDEAVVMISKLAVVLFGCLVMLNVAFILYSVTIRCIEKQKLKKLIK